jgi:hypothetical protein
MEPQAAAAVSEMLCVNTTLHTLCVGDEQFGDQVHQATTRTPTGFASVLVRTVRAAKGSACGVHSIGKRLHAVEGLACWEA